EWIKDNTKAKEIICWKISCVVLSLLDEKKSASKQWEILAGHYAQVDILSQFELQVQISMEHLKDASDATRYLGAFQNACRRFIEMGVTFTNDEAVFMFLEGLPKTVKWKMFK
ncbi:hypothetical protein BS17DRAFT_685162, partial [Gyrodon lividus]